MADLGSLGTAYVEIKADLSGLQGQFSAAVSQVSTAAGALGEKAGASFSEDFTKSFDIAPAMAEGQSSLTQLASFAKSSGVKAGEDFSKSFTIEPEQIAAPLSTLPALIAPVAAKAGEDFSESFNVKASAGFKKSADSIGPLFAGIASTAAGSMEQLGFSFEEAGKIAISSTDSIREDLSHLGPLFSGVAEQSTRSFQQMGLGLGEFESIAVTSADSIMQDFSHLGPLFSGTAEIAQGSMQQLGFAFSEADSIVVTASDSMAEATKGVFARISEAAGPAMESLKGFQPALNQIGQSATQLGGILSVGVTLPIVGLGAAAVKSFGDIDSLKRGLTAVAGSAGEAEKQFIDMIEVAKLPGLGLEEAVKGSISLQAFGFSAEKAKETLLAFGNAIATVGGGKAELDGVIRQLGQMAGAGQVLTQDLRPIIQQVPQVATVLKQAFGDDILSEPAKRLAALGVSTKQFIQVMVTELGKLPPVTGGIKNDLENFSDAATRALADIGSGIAPLVHTLSESLVPIMQEVAKTFSDMPGAAQGVVIGFAGIAAAAGPVVFVLGSVAQGLSALIELAGTLKAIVFTEWFIAAAGAVALLGAALAGIGLGVWIANIESARPPVSELEGAVQSLGIKIDDLQAKMKAGGLTAEQYATHLQNILRNNDQQAGSGKSSVEALAEGIAKANAAALTAIDNLPTLDAKIQALDKAIGNAGVHSIQAAAANGQLSDSEKQLIIDMEKSTLSAMDNTASMKAGWTVVEPYSKSVGDLVTAQANLRKVYDDSVTTYNDLVNKQKEGADVAVALALAHDKMTEAYKKLNPQIAESEKATKAATEARKADSAQAAKDEADALKIFEEAKKRFTDLEALQKSGVEVTQSLKDARKDLDSAMVNLIQTTNSVADAEREANAGTEQWTAVSEKQREALSKVSDAAKQYVTTTQAATVAQLDHEIAVQRVVGVLIDGVTYIHSFSDAEVEAAKNGTLSWKQIQEAVLGVTASIKMVPQVVDVAKISIEDLASGAVSSLGDISGAVVGYEGSIDGATTKVTDHLAAVRILRGEGVQHIETLTDEIGKMGKQWVTATEAIYGNSKAIPQWVQDNTLAIVNGVHIVSDAAAAAHAAADGLHTGLDGVSTGMQGVGSHADEAVTGINKVAAAAKSAGDSISSYSKDLAGMNLAPGSTLASRGQGSGQIGGKLSDLGMEDTYGANWQGSSIGIGNFNADPLTAQGGDIRSIQNVYTLTGGMVINVQTWLQSQLDGIKALMDTGMSETAAEILAESGLGVMKAQHIKQLQDEAAATSAATAAALAATQASTAQADQTKLADAAQVQANLSVSDLTDELWSLIDAGQSNSEAAYNLRQQIAALGNQTQVTSNIYSDAASASKSFSAAVAEMAATTVAAAQVTTNAATQARAAIGLSLDALTPIKTALASPTSPNVASFMPTALVNQGGKLVLVQAPIYIQAQSPESIGAQVTSTIQRAVGGIA